MPIFYKKDVSNRSRRSSGSSSKRSYTLQPDFYITTLLNVPQSPIVGTSIAQKQEITEKDIEKNIVMFLNKQPKLVIIRTLRHLKELGIHVTLTRMRQGRLEVKVHFEDKKEFLKETTLRTKLIKSEHTLGEYSRKLRSRGTLSAVKVRLRPLKYLTESSDRLRPSDRLFEGHESSSISSILKTRIVLNKYMAHLQNARNNYDNEIIRESEMSLFFPIAYECDYLKLPANTSDVFTMLKVSLFSKNKEPYTIQQIDALNKVINIIGDNINMTDEIKDSIIDLLDDHFDLTGPFSGVDFFE